MYKALQENDFLEEGNVLERQMKLELNGRVCLGRKEVLERKQEAAAAAVVVVVVALAKTLAAAMALQD